MLTSDTFLCLFHHRLQIKNLIEKQGKIDLINLVNIRLQIQPAQDPL